MLDKNGVEIKTGDIVEISGAYFKNDNGLYFVTHSPGDPTWSGRDYSLKRISKYCVLNPDFAPLLSTTWKERRTFGKGQRMKSRRNSPS